MQMPLNFGELMSRHGSEVFAVALGITGNPEDAQEAAQETFAKAYERRDEFCGPSKLSTWLTRVASEEAFTILRRRQLRPVVSLEEPLRAGEDGLVFADRAGDPEDAISWKQLGDLLRRTIEELPAPLRAVVLECDIQRRPIGQTAAALKVPAAAVRERLVRARKLLRQKLVPCSRSCSGSGVHCLLRPCARYFESRELAARNFVAVGPQSDA